MNHEKVANTVGWIFAIQTLGSFGYGFVLAIVNISNPGFVELLARSFSVVTEPLAGFLPIANYAEQLANPNIFLSVALIRHVFPLLMIFNCSTTILCLVWLPRVSDAYGVLLESDPRSFGRSLGIWLFSWVIAIGVLFIGPTIEVGFDLRTRAITLLAYIAGSVAPSLLAIGSYRLSAMMWASEHASRSELNPILSSAAESGETVKNAAVIAGVASSREMRGSQSESRRDEPFSNLALTDNRAQASTIPVVTAVRDAYRSVFQQWKRLLGIAWPVVIIFVAIDLVAWRAHQWIEADQSTGLNLTVRALGLLQPLLLIAFAVQWHHFELFAAHDLLRGALFFKAVVRFVLYLSALTVLAAIPVAVAMVALGNGRPNASLFYVISVVAVWCIGSRLALIFPAAAYGRPLGWHEAWQRLRGNSWRLITSLLLACGPIILVAAYLVAKLLWIAQNSRAGLSLPWQWYAIDSSIDAVTKVVMIALATAIVCNFYRRLVLARSL